MFIGLLITRIKTRASDAGCPLHGPPTDHCYLFISLYKDFDFGDCANRQNGFLFEICRNVWSNAVKSNKVTAVINLYIGQIAPSTLTIEQACDYMASGIHTRTGHAHPCKIS